jgi:hypothetical protein
MRRLQRRLIFVVGTLTATAGILVALAVGASPAPPSVATAATGTTGATGPTMPAVTTGPAYQVRTTSAVLNGTVNPEGQPTTWFFQYGQSTAYGLQTGPGNAGSGTGSVAVHASVRGLVSHTTYHYRLVAQGPGGTAYGADATFNTTSPQSEVRFIGREGFVSPGRIIGVEAGCFGGNTRCLGHVTMSHNGVVIGQGDFNIAPESGGFQNIEISRAGEQMLRSYNGVFHLLPVTVAVSTTTGQQTSQVMHLARWVWR